MGSMLDAILGTSSKTEDNYANTTVVGRSYSMLDAILGVEKPDYEEVLSSMPSKYAVREQYAKAGRKSSLMQSIGDAIIGGGDASPAQKEDLTFKDFVNRADPEWVERNPIASKALAVPGFLLSKAAELFPQGAQNWATRAGETGAEFATMTDNPNKATTGIKAADFTADLLGGVMGFVAEPTPATAGNVGKGLWRAGELVMESAANKALPKMVPIAKTAVVQGGAALPWEATRAAVNERSLNPQEAAMAVGSNAILSAVTHGISSRLGRGKAEPQQELDFLNDKPEWADVEDGPYSWKPPILALPEGKGITYSNIPNWEFGTPPAPRTFTSTIEELIPDVQAMITPPMERFKNLVDYVHEGLGGEISKNEIRRMSYDDLAEMAQEIAAQRQADLYSVAREVAGKKGYDLETLYRMETDPAFAAERQRMADVAGVPEEAIVSAKRAQPPEIEALNQGVQKKVGPFRLGQVEHAPEAFQNPEFAAANELSKAVSGKEIIPFKGRSDIHGASDGERVFVNAKSKQPLLYVTSHEIAHNIESTSPETFARLNQIVREHIADVEGLRAHYEGMGYAPEDLPRELTADAMAESMLEPSFWSRVREKAPELLQPILEALDRIITTFKQKAGQDMSIMPYLRDIETMRTRLADEYRGYLADMRVGKAGGKMEPAAKMDTPGAVNADLRFKQEAPQANPAEDIKNVIYKGAAKAGKRGMTPQRWVAEMKAEHGDVPNLEQNLGYIWHRSNEINATGKSVIKFRGNEIGISRDEMASMIGKQTSKTTLKDNWNHVVSKTKVEFPRIKHLADAAYRLTVDDLYRLKQMDKILEKTTGKYLSADSRAHLLALNARQAQGTAKQVLTEAMYDPYGNRIGESLASITKTIPKGKEQDFSNYLVYRHAPTWIDQGRNVFPEFEGITSDVSRQRAAAYEAENPEFKQAADSLVQWQRDFGKAWLVDTGIIDESAWAALENMYPDYVPLNRKMKDIEIGGNVVKRGFANQSSPVKKAVGSQREIIDPIESIIENVDKYIKIARRNGVMQTIYRNVQEDAEVFKDLIEIVPESGDTIESFMQRVGIDGISEWFDEPPQSSTVRKSGNLNKANVVRARVDGQSVHLQVNDKPLLDALTSLGPQATGGIIEAARQVSRAIKVLTTGANVFFASRNIVRDIPSSYAYSKNLSNVPVIREAQFAADLLDSIARIVTGGRYDPGNYYETYKALGGGSHSSAIASDRNLLGEAKAKVLPGYYDIKKPVTSAGRGLKGIGRGVEGFTNAVETIPRLPEYIRTVKKGGNTPAARQEGIYNAQDVTVNFSKHGTLAHQADAGILYLNAALQGLDKMGREIRENPFHLVLRGIAAISLPTIGLYMINRDDPNYKKLSSFIRDNYYCIPKGDGTFIKIAKPRELGQVFGSLVERSLARWVDDDPDGYRGFKEAWFTNFIPPIRTIAAPLNDIRSNKNFADVPIVPGYMDNLSPEMQYDETTSIPAIKLGQLTGVSPKQIDYGIRSYTGFIGELGIPASSQGRGQTPLQRIGEAVQKPYYTDPVYSNDIMSRFYDEKTKLDNAAADFKISKVKSADYNESRRKKFNAVADDISEINKKIRKINADTNTPYEQKKEQTRALKDRANSLAERLVGK